MGSSPILGENLFANCGLILNSLKTFFLYRFTELCYGVYLHLSKSAGKVSFNMFNKLFHLSLIFCLGHNDD